MLSDTEKSYTKFNPELELAASRLEKFHAK